VTNRQARGVIAVLVHGGFLGPWIWADTVELLKARGVRPVTVDLPSSQDGGDRLAGLHDDAQAVRDALDGCTDAVLCGHSYAGAVISEAAAGPHPAVRHLVFLAAAVPDTGDSLASLAETSAKDNPAGAEDESGGEEIDVRADGRMIMRPESARAALFHDCPPGRAESAIALLRPQAPATGTQPVTGAAWRDIPSTYVRCSQDRLPYELVSPTYWEHASHVLTLPAGHCPQWSRPDLVADLLWSVISSARRQPIQLPPGFLGGAGWEPKMPYEAGPPRRQS
jgi:pimeloyl-ACP methyl ester carboxylesterase